MCCNERRVAGVFVAKCMCDSGLDAWTIGSLGLPSQFDRVMDRLLHSPAKMQWRAFAFATINGKYYNYAESMSWHILHRND